MQASRVVAANDDSSDDDVDVGYVDNPLVEEDSEGEEETTASKKKRKINSLKSNREEKKKNRKISEDEAKKSLVLITAQDQLNLLIESQNDAPGPRLEDSVTVNDFLEGEGSNEGDRNSSRSALNMVDALAFSGLKKLLKTGLMQLEPGCPLALIVCPSAARCTQVIANISKRYHCRVAKLYAKHMKIPDQIESLKQVMPIAVGTPSRIAKLIELSALRLSHCSTVLLDVTLDAKLFHLLSLVETKGDTFSLLHTSVLPELEHLKLGLIREEGEAAIVLKKPNQKPNWVPKVKGATGAGAR